MQIFRLLKVNRVLLACIRCHINMMYDDSNETMMRTRLSVNDLESPLMKAEVVED